MNALLPTIKHVFLQNHVIGPSPLILRDGGVESVVISPMIVVACRSHSNLPVTRVTPRIACVRRNQCDYISLSPHSSIGSFSPISPRRTCMQSLVHLDLLIIGLLFSLPSVSSPAPSERTGHERIMDGPSRTASAFQRCMPNRRCAFAVVGAVTVVLALVLGLTIGLLSRGSYAKVRKTMFHTFVFILLRFQSMFSVLILHTILPIHFYLLLFLLFLPIRTIPV